MLLQTAKQTYSERTKVHKGHENTDKTNLINEKDRLTSKARMGNAANSVVCSRDKILYARGRGN
jgi:hypothetical protein